MPPSHRASGGSLTLPLAQQLWEELSPLHCSLRPAGVLCANEPRRPPGDYGRLRVLGAIRDIADPRRPSKESPRETQRPRSTVAFEAGAVGPLGQTAPRTSAGKLAFV